MSPDKARREARIFESGKLDHIDYGYCNPRKAKQASEEEERIRKEFFREAETLGITLQTVHRRAKKERISAVEWIKKHART